MKYSGGQLFPRGVIVELGRIPHLTRGFEMSAIREQRAVNCRSHHISLRKEWPRIYLKPNISSCETSY